MPKMMVEKLRCPKCFASLAEGEMKLLCAGPSPHEYDIKFGIPAFTDDADFEDHWSAHAVDSIPPTKIERAEVFLEPALAGAGEADGISVLDVGCGNGVHAAVVSSKRDADIEYHGVDLSAAALMAIRQRGRNAALVRADALNLPMQDGIFDVAFSYGVLGYTGSPERGVREIARVLKPGGLMGIWLAPVQRGLSGLILSTVRMICRHGGSFVTQAVANIIVPFLPVISTNSGMSLRNASWKQCKEVVLVNIQPENLIYPSRKDVLSWLDSAGMRIETEDHAYPITLWARKL